MRAYTFSLPLDWDGETQEFETLDELVRKMEEVREAMPLLGAPQ